ncbi:MAG: thioredoxin family protein [Bacteroidetes bacterium]|nr:MAG: thioredoxin family protein [Bacteroidota bacterium]
MKKLLVFIFALALFPLASFAQDKALTAESVLKLAYEQAGKDNKKILLMFHASWCGWCKKMDKSLQDETCKQFFDDNFVITHLTVQEGANKKYLENEGADALMEKWGGKGQGLPFWVVLDAKGELLGNALMPNGENTGCPAQKEEVAHFVSVLKKVTKVSKKEAEKITQRFEKNASR